MALGRTLDFVIHRSHVRGYCAALPSQDLNLASHFCTVHFGALGGQTQAD